MRAARTNDGWHFDHGKQGIQPDLFSRRPNCCELQATTAIS